MPTQNAQTQKWLDEATDAVDSNAEGGLDVVAELLAGGHVAYYSGVVEGRDCYLKEYPSGRLEELAEDDGEEDTVIRVIRE